MFKQICFFRKRPDMSLDEFMDYYENQHSQLSKRMGRSPSIPNALRYVRRYLTPEKNPVTGEVHDCGYDCIMEIWWNSRKDFENSQRVISDPARLPAIKEDENHLFASHANPVCSVVEYDSPMGPNGETIHVDLRYEDRVKPGGLGPQTGHPTMAQSSEQPPAREQSATMSNISGRKS